MGRGNALVVPDPIKAPVPRGWCQESALPMIERMTEWDMLDEAEASLRGVVSLIESLGGDVLEFEKALRVVEHRRGCLLKAPVGRPRNGDMRVPIPADTSEKTVDRWRAVDRHWPKVWRAIQGATAWRDVTQAAVLRLIGRWENEKLVAQRPSIGKDVPPCPTLVLDPPWDWGDEGDVSQFGRGDPTYATMPIAEIAALPVGKWATPDAHLYLWITNRSLPKGFDLLKGWGFRYVTMLTWCKPSFGMGNYYRGQTEHVLFGVRGQLALLRNDAGTVFHTPGLTRRQHSEKPEAFYKLVESCSPGPWREQFARTTRKGWYCEGIKAHDDRAA